MIDLLLQQFVNGLTQGVAYAFVALGLTMIFGVLHVVNFAQGEFYMLGGFATVVAVATLGLPFFAAVPIAIVVVLVVAWLVDRVAVGPVLETREGDTMVLLTTFAFSLLILHSVLGAWGPTPVRIDALRGGFQIGPVYITSQRLLVIIAGAIALLAVEFVMRRTRIGKQIRAVAQSPFAASVVGINVPFTRTVTFLGAAGLAALAGALLVPVTLFTPMIGHHAIINAFVIVVIGGMGNPMGAVVCGILLGIMQAYVGVFMPQEFGNALIYALLLAALLVRPQGLFAGGRS